jgi:integrase/recombinase XerD
MTPLRQRMTEDMELRGLSRHTRRAYLQYVAIFAQYFHKSPEVLGPAEIRAFQLYLTQERHLSPSSCRWRTPPLPGRQWVLLGCRILS